MNEYLYYHYTLVQWNYRVTPKKWTRNNNTFTETTIKQDHWLHNTTTKIDNINKKNKTSLCSITWPSLIYCLTEHTVRPPLWLKWLINRTECSPSNMLFACSFQLTAWDFLSACWGELAWTLNKRSRFLVRKLSPSPVLWWSHLAEPKVKEILIQGGIFKHISMECISLCAKISDIGRWSAQSVATILWRRRPSSAVSVERDCLCNLHPHRVSQFVIE